MGGTNTICLLFSLMVVFTLVFVSVPATTTKLKVLSAGGRRIRTRNEGASEDGNRLARDFKSTRRKKHRKKIRGRKAHTFPNESGSMLNSSSQTHQIYSFISSLPTIEEVPKYHKKQTDKEYTFHGDFPPSANTGASQSRIEEHSRSNSYLTSPIPTRSKIVGKNPEFVGFLSIPGNFPYDTHCRRCAYVTGAGHMTGSGSGREIDSHDCVIRSNDAPTTGYEHDVGSKTTMRTVDLRSVETIRNRIHDTTRSLFDRNITKETIVVVYDKVSNIRKAKQLMENMLRRWPDMKFYTPTIDQQERVRQVFASRVADLAADIWISNGFSTLLLLHDICDEIHVYGVADADHCRRLNETHQTDTQYHYYDRTGFECAIFKTHAQRKTWAHRFLKEKRIFGEWAIEWGNLYFHNPEWPGQNSHIRPTNRND